ncbi:MAG: hypothetical protein QHG99_05315 [Methanomicrobiales archaeon]|nr:hypothetical protein [Methanomicrobiales archaeon]
MDEASRQEFKIKFMVLVVLLNVVILMYALAVLLFLLLKGDMRLPVSSLLFFGAVCLSYLTWQRYHQTKKWLDQHAGQKADASQQAD